MYYIAGSFWKEEKSTELYYNGKNDDSLVGNLQLIWESIIGIILLSICKREDILVSVAPTTLVYKNYYGTTYYLCLSWIYKAVNIFTTNEYLVMITWERQ